MEHLGVGHVPGQTKVVIPGHHRISGRRFFGLDTCLENISFLADELLADEPDLEILLDDNSPISDDYPGDEESLEIGDFD